MTSSEEASSKLATAICQGLERALVGFAFEPDRAETKYAVVAALTNVVEIEARRLIEKNIELESKDGKVTVSIGAPVAVFLRDLLGAADTVNDQRWSYEVTIPEWKHTDVERPMTRPYIDPRTKRPTRGHPM
jgi:hypothetical protein